MGETTRTEGEANVRRRMYIFAAVLIAVLLITLALYAV